SIHSKSDSMSWLSIISAGLANTTPNSFFQNAFLRLFLSAGKKSIHHSLGQECLEYFIFATWIRKYF
ncbi:hypothetical protein, partial [uncultured Algoriphagus sp.]|uniref:hypothetical protein n=1 Tax=uncultured Algoriphagus sp. TaxID=417365 RepID=UPI0032B13011